MKQVLSMLLIALTWGISIYAEEAVATVLNVETQNGQTYHFLLADQQPVIKSQNGQMQVSYLAQTGDAERTTLSFSHQDVKRLTFSPYNPTAVPAVKQEENGRIFFDLSGKGRVMVRGLQDGQRVTVYTLDGRSAVSPVRSSGGHLTIDLSGQPCGTYLINAGGQRTFKWNKP